jgi:hypothetical protein
VLARARVRLDPPPREVERDEPDRDEVDRDEVDRDEPERVEPERVEPEREDPELRDVVRERLPELLARLLVRERDRPLERLERERRVLVARWSRGMSARTTSLTSRPISVRRNLAIRSSSRRMLFASCAVSRSPTSVASVSMRV